MSNTKRIYYFIAYVVKANKFFETNINLLIIMAFYGMAFAHEQKCDTSIIK